VLGDEAYEALAAARATMTIAATATSHSTRSTGSARTDAWGCCQACISGDQGDFLGTFGQCDIGGGVDAPTRWIPAPYRLSTAAEIRSPGTHLKIDSGCVVGQATGPGIKMRLPPLVFTCRRHRLITLARSVAVTHWPSEDRRRSD
jgi:hypothetical protein